MFKDAFKNILNESRNITEILHKEFPEVRFKLTEGKSIDAESGEKDFIYLMIFVVVYKERKKGHGTRFVKRLVELAEVNNVDVFLTPDDSYAEKGDMKKTKLTKWYKELGFVKKKRDDFRVQATMCNYS